MRQPELDELLGAWALGALEPEEHAAVDRYLSTEPAARAEAERLSQVARALRHLAP